MPKALVMCDRYQGSEDFEAEPAVVEVEGLVVRVHLDDGTELVFRYGELLAALAGSAQGPVAA